MESHVSAALTALNAGMSGDGWRETLDGHASLMGNLASAVMSALPLTDLIGGTQHSGIYFSKRTSLVNLTIRGYNENSFTTTTYRPLITGTPLNGADAPGFRDWRNLAVVGNRVVHEAIDSDGDPHGVIDGAVLGVNQNNYNYKDVLQAQNATGLLVKDNDITSIGQRMIGGAIGAWANFDTVDRSLFINNSITADRVASGSAMAPNVINMLRNSVFYGNTS
jgi:hypothetical protein